MATEIRFRRGTTAQHSTFTGASGEVTVDTDKKTLVVHDGVTVGGTPLVSPSSVIPSDNSVSTVKIQNSAVTTAKIADANVTGAKLSTTADTSVDDTDELLYLTSSTIKRSTLTGLLTSIFTTARTIANARFQASSFGLMFGSFRRINSGTLTADRNDTWPDRDINFGNINVVPSVKSGQLTATLGGLLTFAHGLGTTPPAERLFASIINTSGAANLGYDNGVELVVRTDQTGSTSGRGIQVWADATNIYGRVGNTALAYINNGSTGAGAGEPTVANWKVYLGVL